MFFAPSSLVLRNRDLLDIIFEFFDSDERRALLRASLTSKAFLEPALNTLWRVMFNVWPLFRLLPTFNKDTHTFTAVVHDEHIQRLLYYARRIHELTLNFELIDDYPDLDLDIVFSIFNRINKAAAFSSLRNLTVLNPKNGYRNQLALFFTSTPNLEVLDLWGAFPGIPTGAFLYAISTISHNLKYVSIANDKFDKAVFDVLLRFRKLETLDLSYITCQIPTSFLEDCASSMTSLQSLAIAFNNSLLTEDIGAPGGPSMALSSITFNLLSILRLTGPPRNVENTLNILYVPQLVHLDLGLESSDGEIFTDIRPIFRRFLTLNGPCLKDRLRTLYLYSEELQSDIKDYLDSFQTFTQLDTLNVDAWDCFFSTSCLANFLRGNRIWSNLTVLHLTTLSRADENQVPDTFSIAALPLLAGSFPNLLRLTITIDNADQDAMKTIAVENLRKGHNLESLAFHRLPRDWSYSSPAAVTFALFLHQLFPKLKTVETECYGSKQSEWMANVREILEKEGTNSIETS